MVFTREADATLPGTHAAVVRAEIASYPAVFEREVMGCFFHGHIFFISRIRSVSTFFASPNNMLALGL